MKERYIYTRYVYVKNQKKTKQYVKSRRQQSATESLTSCPKNKRHLIWIYVSPIGTATSVYRNKNLLEDNWIMSTIIYAENNILLCTFRMHAELQLTNWDCSGKYSRRRMLRRSKVCLAKIGAREIETYVYDNLWFRYYQSRTFLKPIVWIYI